MLQIARLHGYDAFLRQALSSKGVDIRKREAEALRARIERELAGMGTFEWVPTRMGNLNGYPHKRELLNGYPHYGNIGPPLWEPHELALLDTWGTRGGWLHCIKCRNSCTRTVKLTTPIAAALHKCCIFCSSSEHLNCMHVPSLLLALFFSILHGWLHVLECVFTFESPLCGLKPVPPQTGGITVPVVLCFANAAKQAELEQQVTASCQQIMNANEAFSVSELRTFQEVWQFLPLHQLQFDCLHECMGAIMTVFTSSQVFTPSPIAI